MESNFLLQPKAPTFDHRICLSNRNNSSPQQRPRSRNASPKNSNRRGTDTIPKTQQPKTPHFPFFPPEQAPTPPIPKRPLGKAQNQKTPEKQKAEGLPKEIRRQVPLHEEAQQGGPLLRFSLQALCETGETGFRA